MDTIEGKKFDNGFAIIGEIYTTTLEFPFEGKSNSPVWFEYDPEKSIYGFQLIQGEIVGIEDFNEYKARVEIFVHQTGKCENIKNLFPEKVLPESMYDVDCLFPVGSLSVHFYRNFMLVSSMNQDGGNRALIVDDENYPRIIIYEEGWFNHWQSWAGNIRIDKNFLLEIINQANVEK